MPKTDDVSPIAARLGDKLNRPLPEGVSSKVYRVRGPVELHERLAACRSPKELGELLAAALSALDEEELPF